MARRRVGLLGLGAAAIAGQCAVILWRGSTWVRSDAGPGGDLRVALAWTTLGTLLIGWLEKRRVSNLALYLAAGAWLWMGALVWLQALAGKPLFS